MVMQKGSWLRTCQGRRQPLLLRKAPPITPEAKGGGLDRVVKLVDGTKGILLGVTTILVGLLAVYLVWQHVRGSRGADIIELTTFEVPEDVHKQGTTGEVVGADIAQKLRAMSRQVSASRRVRTAEAAAFALADQAGDIDIQVPGSSLSFKDVTRAIRAGFANRRFEASGNVLKVPAGFVMHVRLTRLGEDGQAWNLVESAGSVEELVGRGARFIAFRVNPYALVKHELTAERLRCADSKPCDFSVALDHIKRMIPEGTPNEVASAYLAWCFALGHAKQLQEAANKCRFAAQVDPERSVTYQNWGVALNHLGSFAEASEKFERALRLDPRNASALFGMGDALWKLARPDESLRKFAEGAALSPDTEWPLVSWGSRLLSQNRVAEGLAKLKLAVKNDPGDVEAWRLVGVAHSKLGDSAAELESWRNVAELAPKNAQAHTQVGVALTELKRHAEAVLVFSRAIELSDPKSAAWPNLALGDALLELKRYEEAIAAYRRSRAIRETSDAYARAGLALAYLNQPQEALAEYEAASRIAPDRDETYSNWADALLMLKQFEAAVEKSTIAIEKAKKAGRESKIGHINRAHAHLAVGRIDLALSDYRKATEIDPAFADAFRGLGDALSRQGKIQEANALYRKADTLKK